MGGGVRLAGVLVCLVSHLPGHCPALCPAPVPFTPVPPGCQATSQCETYCRPNSLSPPRLQCRLTMVETCHPGGAGACQRAERHHCSQRRQECTEAITNCYFVPVVWMVDLLE